MSGSDTRVAGTFGAGLRGPIGLVCALVAAMACSGVAQAQNEPGAGPVASEAVGPDDLAARVRKLEDALARSEAKAAADKKKAAAKPTFQITGRTFVDMAFFSQDEANKAALGDARNGIGFRAARLEARGEFAEIFSYCTEIEFVSGIFDNDGTRPLLGDGIQFKQVWMGVSGLPVVQNARVGHVKEPFFLEQLTSNKFITFMERSMIDQALVPAEKLGAMLFGKNESQTFFWQTGVFQNDIDSRFVSRTADDLAGAWTSRAAWLPWYDECTEGRGLLHLGAAYSYRDAFANAHRFRAQPNARFGAPLVVDAGAPLLDDYHLAGLEAALVFGPLSIQSEYVRAMLESPTAADQDIWGFYVTLSYFLTGENRGYHRDLGRFDRVHPFENFFRVRAEDGCVYTGRGAWELAYRFDYLDATDVSAAAGLAANHTLGVNWYLTAYNRIMGNWVHSEPQKHGADAGTLDALMMRFQADF